MLKGVWRKGNPLTLLVGIYIDIAKWRTVWRFLKKLEVELPYDLAIPLLVYTLRKPLIQENTCTPMFIAALFKIARTW